MDLKIIKAKPNPIGKDRINGRLTPQQLAGEWVDVQNISLHSINLATVQLYHYAYRFGGQIGEWQLVTGFNGILPVGSVMRVHSGFPIPLMQMFPIDTMGADFHVFSNKNYVWNNKQKDHPGLWDVTLQKWVDQTYYDAFLPEGKVLIRVGDKLVY